MKALILLIGLIAPPPADAIDDWKRAGSENLEATRWMTQEKSDRIPFKLQELRKLWHYQAIGDLETYSKKSRIWRQMYVPKEKPE